MLTTIPANGLQQYCAQYAVRSAITATAELLVIDTLALKTHVCSPGKKNHKSIRQADAGAVTVSDF